MTLLICHGGNSRERLRGWLTCSRRLATGRELDASLRPDARWPGPLDQARIIKLLKAQNLFGGRFNFLVAD